MRADKKIFAVNYSEGSMPLAVSILVKAIDKDEAKLLAEAHRQKAKQYAGRNLVYVSTKEQPQ